MKKESINKLLVCIIPILITLIYYSIFRIKYYVVDDVLINYIVDGVYGVGKNQWIILPYMSVLLTYFMYILKSFFSNINIYLITLLVIYSCSFSCIQYEIYKKYESVTKFIIVTFLQIVLFQYFTYTMIAYVTCFTGLLMIWTSKHKRNFIEGSFMLIVALSIRKDVFFSLIVILFPYIVYQWHLLDKKRTVFNIFISLICFFSIGVINNLVIQHDATTQKYLSWNEQSTLIRDYKPINYTSYEDVLRENNISQNDLQCLNNWVFSDKSTLGEKQLEFISDVRPIYDKYNLNPIQLLEEFFHNSHYLIFSMLMILILSVHRWKNILGLSTILASIAILGALLIRQRVVGRVYFPIMVLSIILLIYISRETICGNRLSKKMYNFFLTILIILCTICGFLNQNWFQQQGIKKDKEVYSFVKNNSENLFVFENFSAMVKAQYSIEKLRLKSSDYLNNIMTLGNWDTYSVRYYDQMKKFFVENPDDLISELYHHNNIHYFFSENSSKKTLITKWYLEHLNKKVRFKEIDRVSKYVVYKLEEI